MTARTTVAGILHRTRTAEQTRTLLDALTAEILAEDNDRTRTQQQRARAAQTGIIGEILAERARQDADFGAQDRQDNSGNPHERELGAERAELAARINAIPGRLTWLGILVERVYRLGAEDHPDRIRPAIVQVAATAVAWLEAIDNRRPQRTTCYAECDDGHMYDGACLIDPMINGVIGGNDRQGWCYRCEDQDGCDGILSLGHTTAASARRAYDRHRRNQHNTPITTTTPEGQR